MHLDVNIGAPDHDWDRVLAHVVTLEQAGGTKVQERHDEFSKWVVMTDPEGTSCACSEPQSTATMTSTARSRKASTSGSR